MRKLLKHTFKTHIYLPFLKNKGSFFDFTSITVKDDKLLIRGTTGGTYAGETTDIYYDGNNVGVFAARDVEITNYCNLDLILDFIDFIKSNIDFKSYENEPTDTGMVELTLEDCNKIEDWGKSHMFNECIIFFDKILKKVL